MLPFLASLLCTSELRSFVLLTMTPPGHTISRVNCVSGPWVYMRGQSEYSYLLERLMGCRESKRPRMSWDAAPGDLMELRSVGLPNVEEPCWDSPGHFSSWKGRATL